MYGKCAKRITPSTKCEENETEKLNKLLKTDRDTEEKQTNKNCDDYEPGI